MLGKRRSEYEKKVVSTISQKIEILPTGLQNEVITNYKVYVAPHDLFINDFDSVFKKGWKLFMRKARSETSKIESSWVWISWVPN